jgi:phosphopentomutase
LTADHGNDPTAPGTDHTREYVPLLVYSKKYLVGNKMPILKTFADVGYTIADNFGTEKPKNGTSFLKHIGGK